MKPTTWAPIYQLAMSMALAGLAYSIRTTDHATFQFIVGGLVSLVTGQSIHIGRQASDQIKSGNGGSDGH